MFNIGFLTDSLTDMFGLACLGIAVVLVAIASKVKIAKAGGILVIVLIAAVIGFGWDPLTQMMAAFADRVSKG